MIESRTEICSPTYGHEHRLEEEEHEEIKSSQDVEGARRLEFMAAVE